MYKIKVKTRDKGLRKEDNALLLSYMDGQYAGVMEFMSLGCAAEANTLREKTSKETENYVYIEPIGCRVKHRVKTENGLLRIPSFLEWR
ncbi:hypothetical protein [Bacillus paralicheniformis]|uniref:hypothetical protein n=1 Tax=Bacillus paralicheniformis TaxID=1648923 RepID=UPI00197C6A46|nr:hypothetical protein [Bacillus paralicheniformis]